MSEADRRDIIELRAKFDEMDKRYKSMQDWCSRNFERQAKTKSHVVSLAKALRNHGHAALQTPTHAVFEFPGLNDIESAEFDKEKVEVEQPE